MMRAFGILNVNKPPGRSSRDAVNEIERLVRPAKAGHAGTLDPLATGVLVICVGQATRLIQYVQRMPKRYRATFLLGHRSDTDDVEGDVTILADAPVLNWAAVENVLPRFLGQIQQRPPTHSAIKVAGRRAYEMARRGIAVELAARPVTIFDVSIVHFEYPELQLDIACGSGTYVRSLGRDLAMALGTSAVMSALKRTAIGGFRIEDSVPTQDLTAESLPQYLQSPLEAVAELPQINVTESQMIELGHGRPIAATERRIACRPVETLREWAAVNSAGELVAILCEKQAGQLWPARNFNLE